MAPFLFLSTRFWILGDCLPGVHYLPSGRELPLFLHCRLRGVPVLAQPIGLWSCVSAPSVVSYEGAGLWPEPHVNEKETVYGAQQLSSRWKVRHWLSHGAQCADLSRNCWLSGTDVSFP